MQDHADKDRLGEIEQEIVNLVQAIGKMSIFPALQGPATPLPISWATSGSAEWASRFALM